jgi:hypothetical protein
MTRELLDNCTHATVELKGSASLGGPFGRFERGKPRHVESRDAIAFCLSKPTFRVVQFDAEGSKLADTDDQKSTERPEPASYKRKAPAADDFAVIELQDAAREQAKREAVERRAALEREWLEEERKAKERREAEGEGVPEQREDAPTAPIDLPVPVAQWSPSWARQKLADVLCQALGDDRAADGLSKADIVETLEGLEA